MIHKIVLKIESLLAFNLFPMIISMLVLYFEIVLYPIFYNNRILPFTIGIISFIITYSIIGIIIYYKLKNK